MKDAALYRKLSEPFPGLKEANEAVEGFSKEVRALREKYKLPDTITLISLNYLENGHEGSAVFIAHVMSLISYKLISQL